MSGTVGHQKEQRESVNFFFFANKRLLYVILFITTVLINAFNKYHLIVSGLFSNFKAPTIINKLLAFHVYYGGGGGSFKIQK